MAELRPNIVFHGRHFVVECLVCSVSIKPQMSTILYYTITVCCNRTTHSQHYLPVSVEARAVNLKYARATEKLNPEPITLAAQCLTRGQPRPLIIKLRKGRSLLTAITECRRHWCERCNIIKRHAFVWPWLTLAVQVQDSTHFEYEYQWYSIAHSFDRSSHPFVRNFIARDVCNPHSAHSLTIA